MTLLICGVLLWSVTHMIPIFMPNLRAGIIARVRPGPYRGLFTLSIILSVLLIVLGWRSAEIDPIHDLDYRLRHVTYGLVLLSILFFAAAKGSSRLRRLVRHPMLSGTAIWAFAHLLVNGDSRSLVLFGGMFAWSVLSIVGSNLRDGPYSPPEPGSWLREIRLVMVSIVVYILLVFAHPYFTGVALF